MGFADKFSAGFGPAFNQGISRQNQSKAAQERLALAAEQKRLEDEAAAKAFTDEQALVDQELKVRSFIQQTTPTEAGQRSVQELAFQSELLGRQSRFAGAGGLQQSQFAAPSLAGERAALTARRGEERATRTRSREAKGIASLANKTKDLALKQRLLDLADLHEQSGSTVVGQVQAAETQQRLQDKAVSDKQDKPLTKAQWNDDFKGQVKEQVSTIQFGLVDPGERNIQKEAVKIGIRDFKNLNPLIAASLAVSKARLLRAKVNGKSVFDIVKEDLKEKKTKQEKIDFLRAKGLDPAIWGIKE